MLSLVRALMALVVIVALVFSVGAILRAPAVNTVAVEQIHAAGGAVLGPALGEVIVAEGGLVLGLPAPGSGSAASPPETALPFGATVILTTPGTAFVASERAARVAAATASAGTLMASASPERLNPTALGGATVKGSIYVFLDIASSTVTSVSFWLDDPNRAFNPIQVERSAPYDMLGGSLVSGKPLATGQLTDGAHVVTAVATYADGSTTKVETRFTVNNGASTSPTTTVTQGPTTTTTAVISSAGTLMASASPERLNPTALGGATVKGSIYVFLDIASSTVTSVSFWLDDPNRAFNPIQVERSAPYDMLGGSLVTGKPLATGQLTDGAHVVTAVATYADGSTTKVDTRFTVNNGASTSPTTTVTQGPTTTTTAATTTTTVGVAGSGVRIAPGQSIQAAVDRNPGGTLFIIGAGVHTNQSIVAKDRDQFIGEAGAILDGGGRTAYAFGGGGDSVLVKGLVIQNYAAELSTGVIRAANGSSDWTVSNNEIKNNGGMGIKLGSGWRVIGNNIHHNQQFGIGGGGNNVLVEGNEIAFNNPDMAVDPFNGAGGTKFLSGNNITIRNNYSHNNNGPGLWTDGDAINVLYDGNRVEANRHAGIKHEVSCRATIRNNTVTGNGFGNTNWIAGAGILIANSADVTVTGNTVTNNADGIGGIQSPRDGLNGSNCTQELRNLTVTGNTITMQEGYTGIATNGGSDVFTSWNNRFSSNTFSLGSQGDYFQWAGQKLNLQEWQALGMG